VNEREEEGTIELTPRQLEIVEIVKRQEPITGEQIAEQLGVGRPTLRSDLSVLVMLGVLDAKPKVGYFLGAVANPKSQNLEIVRELKVKDVSGVPIVISETSTVQDAVVELFLENVGSLIVVNAKGMLSGMVSRKDLLKVTLGNPNAAAMPISLVMTRKPNIVTVGPDDSVIEAAGKMIHHEIDGLPVVVAAEGGEAEVVGRLTKTTITRVFLDLFRKT